MQHAKAWALRCQLELQQHQSAVFTTLTYNDENLPPTLQKRDLQLFLKRLRKHRPPTTRAIRFFACGEYGETNSRPHYHAILYGLRVLQEGLIHDTWGLGHTHTAEANPKTIAYTAGYTTKKQGWQSQKKKEMVDPETGELIQYQPPFIQMSQGIGGHARQWPQSWKLYAIHGGNKMAVPRYLHEAWKKQATPLQQEELLEEKIQYALTRHTTPATRHAEQQIAEAQEQQRQQRRKA